MPAGPALPPLRLLSLDGGGCRGMIQLLLLRHLLENLEPEAPNVDVLRPCDYFDVIAGTSAGGLNALMLGRLQFSIGEAIHAFARFTQRVFEPNDGASQALWGGHAFEMARLEEAVDALLGLAGDELMFDPEITLFCDVKHFARPVTRSPFVSLLSRLSIARLLSRRGSLLSGPTANHRRPSCHPWVINGLSSKLPVLPQPHLCLSSPS
jgi:predicted acylesterase/phospholipase RssA